VNEHLNHMIRLLFLSLLLSTSFSSFGQYAKLEITISGWYNGEPEDNYQLVISRFAADTTVIVTEELDYYEKELDSLLPGIYNISISKMGNPPHLEYFRNFQLFPDSITVVHLSYGFSEYTRSKAEDLYSTDKFDVQYSLGYFNNKWIEDHPAVTSHIYAGFSVGQWWAFSKHTGFILGGGAGLSHTSIARDTTFMNQPNLNKRYEYYTYLDLHVDAKLRLSTGNQQINEFCPSHWTIDIGASYYFPAMFKHIAWYSGNQKHTESFLHQYTDCRLFVNFGYSPVLLFAEYRPFNFILGKYPELPQFIFGVRLNLQY